MKGNRYLKWFLFILLCLNPPAYAEVSQILHNSPILILNSYHFGFAWSDREQETIIKGLKKRARNIPYFNEYLDFRRFPPKYHEKEVISLLQKKYKNQKIKLLIVLDDPALELVLKHRAFVFPRIPTVFCGVSEVDEKRLKRDGLITGVVSLWDAKESIRLILRFHPKVREVFVVHDYTLSGLAIKREFVSAWESLPETRRINLSYSENEKIDFLFRRLKNLPSESVVMLLSYANDSTGATFDVSEITSQISRICPVPIYGHAEVRLGYGIVGGKLLSPEIVAEEALNLVWRILQGEQAGKIAPVRKNTVRYMFDYVQLKRFHIPEKYLPPQSIVINKPVSFYQANRGLVTTYILFTLFLFVVIFLLAVILIQNRRSTLALQESQAKYYDLYENAPDMYYSINIHDGTIMECNDTFLRVTGYSKEEVIGRPVFDFYDPESREMAKSLFERFSETGEVRNAIRKVICKDGREIYVSLNVSAVRDKKGKILYSRSIWRDITEQKKLEKELEALTITDVLTGLYNRRGFITLAEQQLRQAERTKEGIILLFADMDNLKQINDTLGHKMGDLAIIDVATVLREVFRKMDIIARIGGDEFAVLTPRVSWEYADAIKKRLKEKIEEYNARNDRHYDISLSIGLSYYDPERPTSLDGLMAQADSLMYEEKFKRKASPF